MNQKTKNILDAVCRWAVGLVFLFSSFVKGVDPMGTAYKIVDYMTAWHIGSMGFTWAIPMAGTLSMVLIILEFTVGVMLIGNAFRKVTPWVLAVMMAFFTVTTLVDALTNEVTDCGCFGDAVKLTNWQTFLKNIILDIPTIFILCYRNPRKHRAFERDALLAVFAVVVMLIFGLYNIKNEPCIDFRPWKVGNQMIDRYPEGQEPEVKSYLVYRNNASGETKQFLSADFMTYVNDSYKGDYSAFQKEWTFVDSRVEDPYEINADGFSMLDAEGEDHATELINTEDYLLIATIHDINKVDEKGISALNYMRKFANENNLQLVLLSSASQEDMQNFLFENKLDDVDYYFADATAIKTILRSNPGFILLKDAKVIAKWPTHKGYKINELF